MRKKKEKTKKCSCFFFLIFPNSTAGGTSQALERKVIRKCDPSEGCFGPDTSTCKSGEPDKTWAGGCGQGRGTHCYLTSVASCLIYQSGCQRLHVNTPPTTAPLLVHLSTPSLPPSLLRSGVSRTTSHTSPHNPPPPCTGLLYSSPAGKHSITPQGEP